MPASSIFQSKGERRECLGEERQTAAPRDAWRLYLAAVTANLGPVTGHTFRKKPPAVWHRWDAIEWHTPLAH